MNYSSTDNIRGHRTHYYEIEHDYHEGKMNSLGVTN